MFGIDVSHWQGKLDWPALKAAGAEFAFVKATESLYGVDRQFARNWPAMKAAGIVRGAYHFFRPAYDPVRQAKNFISRLTLEVGDLPPVLDVEDSGGLPPFKLAEAVQTCLLEIEALCGVRPIIYTGPHFWDTSVGVTSWASTYLLWIANYTKAGRPKLPKDWTSWSIWQFTERGRLLGYPGDLDFNHADSLPLIDKVPQTAQYWRVKVSLANVRSAPSVEGKVLFRHVGGAVVTQLGLENGWVNVGPGEWMSQTVLEKVS